MTSSPAQFTAAGVLRIRRTARTLGRIGSRAGLQPLPSLLSFSLGIFVLAFVQYGLYLGRLYEPIWYDDEIVRQILIQEGMPILLIGCIAICAVSLLVILIGMVIGRRLQPSTLSFLRKCYILGYAVLGVTAFAIYRMLSLFADQQLTVLGQPVDNVIAFHWGWWLMMPLGLLFLFLAVMHLIAWRRRVINVYCGETTPDPALGDQLFESIRSDGRDPLYRRSMYGSLAGHLLIIVIIPWLLRMRGCVEDYTVPKGSGNPAITLVQIVKPPKKKKQKFILNPNSAIIYQVPDLDQSEVEQQVELATQLRHVADPNAVHGAGNQPGQGPGWPDGMDGAVVRFIRLEYRGPDWDDGMDAKQRADLNFLEAFHRRTGFKVAKQPESNAVRQLKDYSKGYAPPFVYMTGSGNIAISAADSRILRDYLLDGGMLFADAGSPQWDRSFRAFMAATFPDKPLITVSDDDPLYQFPYLLPNGAPPLWHHGGNKAMGMKHRGRWIVYYHPGDIGDAWKTGHSGADPALVEVSFDLGVNIIYYAFTQYLQETRKYRK